MRKRNAIRIQVQADFRTTTIRKALRERGWQFMEVAGLDSWFPMCPKARHLGHPVLVG
jgi:hypothetical protein